MGSPKVYVRSILFGRRLWNRGTRLATVPPSAVNPARGTLTRYFPQWLRIQVSKTAHFLRLGIGHTPMSLSSSKPLQDIVIQLQEESIQKNMKPFFLTRKLDSSKDFNKDIALKFDAGKIKSEKYGEAKFSGEIMLLNRHGEYPTAVNTKPIEERACGWLNEIGMLGHQDYIFHKIDAPSLVTYLCPDTNPDKLDLLFKLTVFILLIDDELIELGSANVNNPIQHQEDITRLVKSLISFIESKGDTNVEKEAALKNPFFEATCRCLSGLCKNCSRQMNEDEYTNFAEELVDYFRVNKWLQEYTGMPYSRSDYLFLRFASIGVNSLMFSAFLANDVFLSNEIIVHPLFQRYHKNIIIYIGLTNDFLSFPKEMAENEKENFVLVECTECSLQKSIYEAQKTINGLLMDLKKDEVRLNLYFPADQPLKKYFKAVKYFADGLVYWYINLPQRYGSIKFECYVAEYDCDYKTWQKKMVSMKKENMEEPVFRVQSKNRAIFLSPFPPPPASNAN